MRQISIIMLFFLCPLIAHGSIFGYDSYEDCIIDKMQNQDKAFFAFAKKVCRKKFPLKNSGKERLSKRQHLPVEIMQKISLTARLNEYYFGNSKTFLEGNIYNGTHVWTVKNVTFYIMEKSDTLTLAEFDLSLGKKPTLYSFEINLPPYTTEKFKILVDWDIEVPFCLTLDRIVGTN